MKWNMSSALWISVRNSLMGTTCWLVKWNIIPFIEPIREGVSSISSSAVRYKMRYKHCHNWLNEWTIPNDNQWKNLLEALRPLLLSRLIDSVLCHNKSRLIKRHSFFSNMQNMHSFMRWNMPRFIYVFKMFIRNLRHQVAIMIWIDLRPSQTILLINCAHIVH